MARKRKASIDEKLFLDKKTSSEEKSSSNNEKSMNKVQLIVGLIATVLMIIISLLGFPTKWREFIGPTITPTSISYGNRCRQAFDNSQVEYANMPELQAVTDQKTLQIQLHLIDNLVGIDLGCEANIPFSAQIETMLVRGDSTNFSCLAFGGKPAPQGTLESYFAFCISDEKKWLLLHVDSQTGKQILAEGISDEILGSNGRNLINVKISTTEAELFINGHSIDKVANLDLKSNKVIGLAWATPKDATTLPVWQADNLNVWELDNNAPPTSTNFSLAFVNVSYQIPSSLTPTIETPQANKNLKVTTPIQISKSVASVILLDRSESIVRDPRNESVSRQLIETLLGIAPPDDLVSVGTFATNSKLLLALTPVEKINLETLLSQLRQSEPSGHFASDDLGGALLMAYNQVQLLPSEKQRVIIITDNVVSLDIPPREEQVREIIRDYQQADIQLDIIVLKSDIAPSYDQFESLLREEGINYVIYDSTPISDVPGIAMNAFYHTYTDRPGQIQFALTSPATYQLVVPPNADKFVFFLSLQENNLSNPLSAVLRLTSPAGEQFQRALDIGFNTFTQQNPQPGLWTIELSSSQTTTFNIYSLMLLTSDR